MTESSSDRSRVLITRKAHSLTVALNMSTMYTFDKKGRLIGAYVGGYNYKRGLDNTMLKKWSATESGRRQRHRHILTPQEREEFIYRMTDLLDQIYAHPELFELEIRGDEEKTWKWLRRSLNYDWEKLEADAALFLEIYEPVTILPPDQYYALVIQISEGCSYNKCTFCSFYRDRKFRIKTPAEVRDHGEAINEFFGESLGLRQSVFLADANALIIPQQRLISILKIVNEMYTIIPDPERKREIHRRRRAGEPVFDGIYSFFDLFTGEHKSVREFQEMASLGVKRAYIGIESGSEALLDFLNKPGRQEEMISVVNKVKASGINVGVIVLIGAGGKKYAGSHIEETTNILNAMNLDADDFIYFSEFRPQPNTPYQDVAESEGIEPLTKEGVEEQEQRIRSGLRYSGKGNSPKLTTYDIREFLY